MGELFYLVSPKLKVMFCLGKSFREDTMQSIENKIEQQQKRLDEEDMVDTFDWTVGNLRGRRLKDMIKVVSFYDDLASAVAEGKCIFPESQIRFKKYDRDAYLTSDYKDEFGKLKDEGYQIIDD